MRVVLSVVVAAVAGAACVGSPDFSTTQQDILEKNRIATNRIATNRIATNRIATNRIATNRISSSRFALNTQSANDLLGTPEGRELLQYIVGCAIPPDVSLEANYQGTHYVFPGEVGVAPKWTERALKATEKRWVSACLISRVNAFDVSVPISIRGPHDSLTVTQSEATDFTIEEGAFYGDIFRPIEEPIIWVACRGRDKAAGMGVSLDERICTEPDPAHPGLTKCGFTYAGDCADWVKPKNAYACKKWLTHDDSCHGGPSDSGISMHGGGYYEQCYDEPGNGHWPGATKYDEVVTVFLMP
jgi:hypothetical protein